MPGYFHPRSVGTPIDDWPAPIREAYETSLIPGGIFESGGALSHLKPNTIKTIRQALERFLAYHRSQDTLRHDMKLDEAADVESIRGYVGYLRNRNAVSPDPNRPAKPLSDHTVVSQLGALSQALCHLAPSLDRYPLKHAIGRLRQNAGQKRDKSNLPSIITLHQLGYDLMNNWQRRNAHDPRLNAMDYRDGLIIALIAENPLRRANIAQMRIGEDLIVETLLDGNAQYYTDLEPGSTKNGKRYTAPVSDALAPYISHYLQRVHPILTNKMEDKTVLWPNMHNRPLKPHGLSAMVKNQTRKYLGTAVPPLDFRHSAATYIVEEHPDHARLAAPVLQHQSFNTTEQNYIHGQNLKASRAFNAIVEELMDDESDGDD